MSIDRINISNRGVEASQNLQGIDAIRNAAKGRSASAGADSMEISSKAKDAMRLTASLEQSRADRLSQVQQALEAGTYNVSGEAIARKLIDMNTK